MHCKIVGETLYYLLLINEVKFYKCDWKYCGVWLRWYMCAWFIKIESNNSQSYSYSIADPFFNKYNCVSTSDHFVVHYMILFPIVHVLTSLWKLVLVISNIQYPLMNPFEYTIPLVYWMTFYKFGTVPCDTFCTNSLLKTSTFFFRLVCVRVVCWLSNSSRL